jgi:hypothetical protein
LIQLFLNNQKSTMNFIKDNIFAYKETFSGSEIKDISKKFTLVEEEYGKQKARLKVVEIILWFVPVAAIIFWLSLVFVHLFSQSVVSFLLLFLIMGLKMF